MLVSTEHVPGTVSEHQLLESTVVLIIAYEDQWYFNIIELHDHSV